MLAIIDFVRELTLERVLLDLVFVAVGALAGYFIGWWDQQPRTARTKRRRR